MGVADRLLIPQEESHDDGPRNASPKVIVPSSVSEAGLLWLEQDSGLPPTGLLGIRGDWYFQELCEYQ